MSDTPQHEAKHEVLLTLAEAWIDLTPDERADDLLWANPIICSRALYTETVELYATEQQAEIMAEWIETGLLVLSDNPTRTRNELRAPAKPVNRAARRKAERKRK